MLTNNKWISRALAVYAAALFIATGPSCNCSDKDSFQNKKGRAYGIVLNDNAALRIDPLIYASRVTLLKKGEKVEILDQSKEKSWIGKSCDYWYKVNLKKGLSGWIFGGNLKIFTGSQSSTIDNYLSNLREDEEKALKENLAGKWWSVDKHGDFTNHCVEIYTDGKYKSFARGGKEIEGEYTINFSDNEIVFLKNTSIGQNLKFVQRGNLYHLEADDGNREWRFRKIAEGMAEPSEEPIENAADVKEPVKE